MYNKELFDFICNGNIEKSLYNTCIFLIENSRIEILEDTNWQLQLENCLPTSLKDSIFIPKHEWHRVIKGTGTLKLKIHKL